MFRENLRYKQMKLFGIVNQMPEGMKKMLERSWAFVFREKIFKKIEERRYKDLYSKAKSRPNFPVNIWVGLEIIKQLKDYTDEELIEQFHFNYLTAYAVGLDSLGEVTVCERTLYYNRKRILEYEERTGKDLLGEEFKAITDETLKELGIDTRTQRMDSSFVGSNIKQMCRLELLVKVLQNIYKDLSEENQSLWKEKVSYYINQEADHVSFRLKREEIEMHIKRIGEILFEIHEYYAKVEEINSLKSYEHVGRVLEEQFIIKADKEKVIIEAKPAKEIKANSLQNPADDEATYRKKGDKASQGYVFNIAETCSPGNDVQLITDVSTHQNVISDDTILEERIEEIRERTQVKEMITDASYVGKGAEKKCDEEEVELIPTDIKGRSLSEDKLSLKDFDFKGYEIIGCPSGNKPIKQVQKPKGRMIVYFSKEDCSSCPLVLKCPIRIGKRRNSICFNLRQAIIAKRRKAMSEEAYLQKAKLRPAIEGTISQFKSRMHNGKLRVRGKIRISFLITCMAIAINFQRIFAYMRSNNPNFYLIYHAEISAFIILTLFFIFFIIKTISSNNFFIRLALSQIYFKNINK